MTAPVCVLDVDGVINLLGAGVREECFAFGCDGFLVRTAVALPARLARLNDLFAIHWFTSGARPQPGAASRRWPL